MKNILTIYQRFREQILYVVSGATTTLANIIVYAAATRLFLLPYMMANVLAWIVAITLAYLFNKLIVFASKTKDWRDLLREMMSFVTARLTTLGIESFLLWLGISVLSFPDLPVKVLTNILVIVLNYVFAKLFIFKK